MSFYKDDYGILLDFDFYILLVFFCSANILLVDRYDHYP